MPAAPAEPAAERAAVPAECGPVLLSWLADGEPDGRVRIELHCLHPAVAAWVWRGVPPEWRGLLWAAHQPVLRGMLSVAHRLREAQREFESLQAAADRAGFPARRVPHRLLSPLALHDADTLMAACLWDSASRSAGPCVRCGGNDWAVTATPPRLTRAGRLVRDPAPEPRAVCWGCMHVEESEDLDFLDGYVLGHDADLPPRRSFSP
jgi:hypothetical protein